MGWVWAHSHLPGCGVVCVRSHERTAVITSPWLESWGSCGLDWGLWEGKRAL